MLIIGCNSTQRMNYPSVVWGLVCYWSVYCCEIAEIGSVMMFRNSKFGQTDVICVRGKDITYVIFAVSSTTSRLQLQYNV